MAIYFFDFSDTGEEYPDTEGTELGTFEAAKEEAVRSLVDMAKEVLPDGNYRELAFRVSDDSGRCLIRVSIKFELETN